MVPGKLQNKNRIFEDTFSKYGGSLPVDAFDGEYRENYIYQFDIYNNIIPEIYVGGINNLNFNAVATRNVHGEFIGIFVGALHQLTLFAYQIFSDPEYFSAIGDPTLEQLNEIAITALKSKNYYRINLCEFIPREPARKLAAEAIATCACFILYYHEVAHIKGCHLDLIRSKFNLDEYKEVGIAPVDKSESLILCALEFEADQLAALNALETWRSLSILEEYKNAIPLPPTDTWFIALELLYCVMGTHIKSNEVTGLSSHPSTIARLTNIQTIEGRNEKKDLLMLDAFNNSKHEVRHWFLKNKIASIYDSVREKQQRNDVADEVMELNRQLELLLPELEILIKQRAQRIKTVGQ